MDKVVKDAREAVADVKEGMTLLLGGFGLCGLPENLIAALREKGVRGLTLVSNNAGTDAYGIGTLIANGQVRKMIMSYGGECKSFEEAVLAGKLEVEWTPQGTLAERLRAGGAGIAGFYTPTGVGTPVAQGKESREFDGRTYLFERALKGDFAFVKAYKADPFGNLQFRKTARNFNAVMATAAAVTIAETEHLAGLGELEPDQVHTPGIFVNRVFQGQRYEKPIEKRTVLKREAAAR